MEETRANPTTRLTRDRRRRRPHHQREPEIEWDLAELLIPGVESGMAQVPVVQAGNARAAERVYSHCFSDAPGTYIAILTEWLHPIIDEGWEIEPWWKRGTASVPYAAKWWRLVDTTREELWDTTTDVWYPNPFYRDRWAGWAESPYGFAPSRALIALSGADGP